MRILIFGAGVIGSLYGALLAKAGNDVSVYARGRRLKSLMQNGLQYKSKGRIRLSPGKMHVFQMLPVSLVGWILGLVFQSAFGDRFMYRHSMKAPDEMRQLHEQFYAFISAPLV